LKVTGDFDGEATSAISRANTPYAGSKECDGNTEGISGEGDGAGRYVYPEEFSFRQNI
jgi:hypothetical protein